MNYASVQEAVEDMSREFELQNGILGSVLKKEADETLFLESALRGYDLSKPLRNDDETDTPAEIVKIG